MLSRRDIGEAFGTANPIPDPEHAITDSETDALFAAISRRREAMVLTDQSSRKQEDGAASPRPWRIRRRFVLVAAALLVLIAIPAAAYFIDWEKPPLDREFPEGADELVTYGAEDGVGEYCAWRMAFDPRGAPVVAGPCGVLRLEGNEFRVVNSVAGGSGVMDIAVTPDGTVWLADVDGPVRSVTGGQMTTYSLVARQIEVTLDGTVYAIGYGPTDVPALMRYEGGTFVEAAPGPLDDIAAAPDGSLYTLGLSDYSSEGGVTTEALSVVGRMRDGVYATEPIPDGFEGDGLSVAPDGTLWVIGTTGHIIERAGVFPDAEWVLIRYDGAEVREMLTLPFSEPNDVAIHPDGTVWVSSSLYGLFTHDGDEWVRYSAQGLPDEDVSFVEIGPDGSVYIGTRLGVTRISAESDEA